MREELWILESRCLSSRFSPVRLSTLTAVKRLPDCPVDQSIRPSADSHVTPESISSPHMVHVWSIPRAVKWCSHDVQVIRRHEAWRQGITSCFVRTMSRSATPMQTRYSPSVKNVLFLLQVWMLYGTLLTVVTGQMDRHMDGCNLMWPWEKGCITITVIRNVSYGTLTHCAERYVTKVGHEIKYFLSNEDRVHMRNEIDSVAEVYIWGLKNSSWCRAPETRLGSPWHSIRGPGMLWNNFAILAHFSPLYALSVPTSFPPIRLDTVTQSLENAAVLLSENEKRLSSATSPRNITTLCHLYRLYASAFYADDACNVMTQALEVLCPMHTIDVTCVKGLDTCYSATYMSQTRDQQRFII